MRRLSAKIHRSPSRRHLMSTKDRVARLRCRHHAASSRVCSATRFFEATPATNKVKAAARRSPTKDPVTREGIGVGAAVMPWSGPLQTARLRIPL